MKGFQKECNIRCAVIGYGGAFNMGKVHLDQMQAAGMKPVAVVEIDASRLEVAKSDFPGIQIFTTIGSMLKEAKPDLVTIITPHNTHAELSMKCLESGASVVCEKPMAITLEECDRMIAVAESKDLLLSVYHNRHWDGCILEAVDRIRNKDEIGEVFRVEAHMGGFSQPGDWWRSSRSISGGIHYDWGVHLIEYALQVINSKVVEVSAFSKEGVWQTKWGKDTNQDELTAIVRFANGSLLNLRITHLDSEPPKGEVVFTGTAGKYFMTQNEFELVQVRGDEKTIKRGKNRPAETEKYYLNIAAALSGKAELVITPDWSRRTMEILALATRSAAEGRALLVDS
ncbi:Gfo/Idh/MocA family oxidoreductase [Puniceicoccales bacterium CK1056]|uniref:Gfo/Idh/MocA family oxidoreductase n=1 Tax=Oceanipulchritudo coccoides TaxID=2706888 RepID=A0A6B2LZE7_9BACT|nr:Gfo/Idh/MocA family oxidoreductase [Oceanipulchritudo coccoides]NDV61419.1 Gfo/Idh/MocA family oxidoreductase [Oceanipulchritudo coccoides]